MLNFYRRFMPGLAKILGPLHQATSGKQRNNKIEQTQDLVPAFEDTKDALTHSALLAHPDPVAPFRLTTDALNIAVGAELSKYTPHGWRPLVYFSKGLTNTQKKYSAYDKELLGVFLSIKHFRHNLEGKSFCC